MAAWRQLKGKQEAMLDRGKGKETEKTLFLTVIWKVQRLSTGDQIKNTHRIKTQ